MNSLDRKVLLVTERPLLVAGFRELLRRTGLNEQYSICPASDLAEALGWMQSCLVIVDTDSPFAWEDLGKLRCSTPDCTFVLWCNRVTPEFVRMAYETGVHGLLSARLPLEEASRTLLQICQGERNFRFEPEAQPNQAVAPHLTRREEQVLCLLLEGLKNREIARALHTTQGSVKVYLNRIFRKAGVKTRYELALAARGRSGDSQTPVPFDESWMFRGVATAPAEQRWN